VRQLKRRSMRLDVGHDVRKPGPRTRPDDGAAEGDGAARVQNAYSVLGGKIELLYI